MNEIEAVDRRIFEQIPKLRQILATKNNCVDKNFVNIASVETNVKPFLAGCFQKYPELFPTPEELCTFYDDDLFGYTCSLCNVTFTEDSELPLNVGDHSGGKRNNNVQNIIFTTSKLNKIPISIFTTFLNLKSLSAKGVGLKVLDNLTFERCRI